VLGNFGLIWLIRVLGPIMAYRGGWCRAHYDRPSPLALGEVDWKDDFNWLI